MVKFIVFIVSIISSSVCFSQEEIKKQSFSKDNYSILFPENWRMDTTKRMGTELFIFSPSSSIEDNFAENVNVIVQNLNGAQIDLIKYKQITEKQLSDFLNDLIIFESEILQKDNNQYYKVSYKMTQGVSKLKITSYCIIKNGKAYLVTFTTKADENEEFRIEGEEILNSFSVY